MAQKRTKKAAPKKRRATKKRAKRKPRRTWSPEQKVEMVEYSLEHGVEAACVEYGIVESSLYRWRRDMPKRRKTKAVSKSNGQADATAKLSKENRALRIEVARLAAREAKLTRALVESVLEQT